MNRLLFVLCALGTAQMVAVELYGSQAPNGRAWDPTMFQGPERKPDSKTQPEEHDLHSWAASTEDKPLDAKTVRLLTAHCQAETLTLAMVQQHTTITEEGTRKRLAPFITANEAIILESAARCFHNPDATAVQIEHAYAGLKFLYRAAAPAEKKEKLGHLIEFVIQKEAQLQHFIGLCKKAASEEDLRVALTCTKMLALIRHGDAKFGLEETSKELETLLAKTHSTPPVIVPEKKLSHHYRIQRNHLKARSGEKLYRLYSLDRP